MAPQPRINSWMPALQDAFRRQSVYGLFIDYQEDFLDTHTRAAFFNGAKLSQSLQNHQIPSLWAAWPDKRKVFDTVPYSECDMKGKDRFAVAFPAADEPVYYKYARSIMTNASAGKFIHGLDNPVFIAGGVYANKCFLSSITDVMRLVQCTVIVAQDACDYHSDTDLKPLKNAFNLPAHEQKIKGRYALTTTQQILDALPSLQTK